MSKGRKWTVEKEWPAFRAALLAGWALGPETRYRLTRWAPDQVGLMWHWKQVEIRQELRKLGGDVKFKDGVFYFRKRKK